MNLEEMKESFRECMKHLYPQGVDSPTQMRDLIRVFSMGWCESLKANRCIEGVQAWVQFSEPLADLNWWPDDSWRWW